MKTIAIISQKGGAGKTTLAIHLAVAAELDGKATVILDLDPQASATTWRDLRKAETPFVESIQHTQLAKYLESVKNNGAEFCFLDTAPHSESAALAAARVADLILIPCRPAILDLQAIGNSIELARLAGKTAFVVINGVPSPHGKSLAKEAIEAIEIYKTPVCPVHIGHRIAFQHCLKEGLAVQEYDEKSKANQEIKQLYMWVCEGVGG
jgi:chromosome partitioning protein